jgi:hypothetical protein
MRYRDVNDLGDISRDAAVVVDFIGEEEYRRSLETLGHSLRAKGFVTRYDDAMFSLELDLFNLEMLRARSSGIFKSLPEQCHRGVDFLIGLGQTIPVLSTNAKTRLLGRLKQSLKEGLWPLEHELRIAAVLSKYGWDVYFHDFEEGGGYDFLATQNRRTFEVEAKAISLFTGWPIKPENIDKLLVEVLQHFVWEDENTIPLIGLRLSSSLSPERTQLRQLVAAFNEIAVTRGNLSLSDTQIRFMGTIPNMALDRLQKAAYDHSQMTRKIVLVKGTNPRLVLELDSAKPVQLERKIIKTISGTARGQFSRLNPGVIWTHINFISDKAFTILSSSKDGRACLFDRIVSAALLSEKRNHLSQLVFSGGAFLHKTPTIARSSYANAVYNSPICRFGENFIFPGGRKRPSMATGTRRSENENAQHPPYEE